MSKITMRLLCWMGFNKWVHKEAQKYERPTRTCTRCLKKQMRGYDMCCEREIWREKNVS